MVTKKIKHKNEAGTVVEVDLGAEAKNVSEDANHRFVSDTDKTNWNDANSKKHSHSNKAVLDKLTQTFLNNWSAAYTHVSDAVKHVTTVERTNWNDANTKKHSHSNKGVLDTVTQAMLDKLAGIAAGANNYVHPTSSGNRHIPSGGASGQFLKWSADGTAVWAADNNTTYNAMKGATASAAGGSGLVPAPAAGKQAQYLRGDGTWQTPPDTKYAHPNSGATAGTYRSVTVSAQGHVTAGSNPTTLAGYGITDAATKTEVNDLKKSVADGKSLVAGAISAKGVSTAATATFAAMAENIGKIVGSNIRILDSINDFYMTEPGYLEIELPENDAIVIVRARDEGMWYLDMITLESDTRYIDLSTIEVSIIGNTIRLDNPDECGYWYDVDVLVIGNPFLDPV